MKGFDTNALANAGKPVANEAAAAQHLEPNAHLKQRLWQLLLPVPEKAALPEPSSVGTDTAPKRQDERVARTGSVTGELAATAYLLAGHVQQLSLFETASPHSAPESAHARATLSQAVTLRVDVNTATGGLASLEVSHPELGQIGLAVELADGAVRVTATATTARSAEILQQGQAVLAQRLLQQGIALEALEVVIVNPKKKTRAPARSRPRTPEQET